MKVKGILTQKIGDSSGVSQRTGNQWKSSEWLLTIPGQYTRRIKFEVRNDHCQQWEDFFNNMPDKNAPVEVDFDIDAREYEGKWYNSIIAWNICITSW